jgi:hypothetical protein
MILVLLLGGIVGTASAFLGVWTHGMILVIALKYYFTGFLCAITAAALMSIGYRVYPRMLQLMNVG